MQDLSSLKVNELISLDHWNDGMIDGLGVFISLHHFLVKLGVGNLGTDGNTALDGLFNFAYHRHEFSRCFYTLGCHSTLSRIKCGDLEDSMGFLDMLDLHLALQMNASDSLRETDNGLKLTDCDRNACALLWNLLILWVHTVWDIHILKNMASFFRETREEFHFGIGKILFQIFNADVRLVIIISSLGMSVQVDYMRCDGLISRFLSNILDNEDAIKSRQDRTLEIDLFCSMLEIIIAAENGIGSCQDRSSWI